MLQIMEVTAILDWSTDVRSPLVGLPEALITVYYGTCQATAVKRLSRLLGSGENLHQRGGRGARKNEFFIEGQGLEKEDDCCLV